MTTQEIENIAKEINDISLDYHLSHAIAACNILLRDEFKKPFQKKIEELKKSLNAPSIHNDQKKIMEISQEIWAFSKPARIYVEYVDNMHEDGGRTIKIQNQFVISLPRKLADKSRNQDGSYNIEGIKRLRERIAHELGHIALHYKELLDNESLQGTKLSPDDEEKEVDIFAKKLLDLRHTRNKDLYDSRLILEAF
jgi:Zn-dependent peptidase ImmA (M78 family)